MEDRSGSRIGLMIARNEYWTAERIDAKRTVCLIDTHAEGDLLL